MFTMMKRGYPYPLTPSCLIYVRRTITSSSDSYYEIVSTNEYLTKRAKHHRKLLNEFGKQWRREYLLSIRKSTRASNNGVEDTIAVGDMRAQSVYFGKQRRSRSQDSSTEQR